MPTILTIIMMIVIGAIIGGFTNFIAIKMLFHPYHEKRIFGYKVPFTPGLIPKRRNELSEKVGAMVTQHLLTPEVFKEKLVSPNTTEILETTIKTQFQTLKEKSYTIKDFTDRLDYPLEEKIEGSLHQLINQKVDDFYTSKNHLPLNQLIPKDIKQRLDLQIANVTPLLVERIDSYVSSDKGIQDIHTMVEEFFNQKGRLIGMIQMFMTTEEIVIKVQREIKKVIKQEKTKRIINNQIYSTYENIMEKPFNTIVNEERKNEIKAYLSKEIVQTANISYYINMPLYQLVPNLFIYMEGKGTERFIQYIIQKIGDNISLILDRMKLASLIKDQIDRFELSHLEKLVIEISNKELKLITLLGFVLGGIIGLFQGIIAIFV